MRTCWVIDHPAHFQLFRRWIRPDDTLIVTERQELDVMLQAGFPNPIQRVERVIGRPLVRLQKGWRRQRQAMAFIFEHEVDRIISKGAPFELRAARRMVPERWYLTDTEANTAAHRLQAGTHVLLPESWTGSLKPTHTYPGILPQAYVPLNCEAWHSAQGQVQAELGLKGSDLVVFHRKLEGGGIHDGPEIIDYQMAIRKMDVHLVENKEGAALADGSAWDLPVRCTLFDGVLTGSTTLAAEAVVQGVPTLLISKAERGFLDFLADQPHFFHWKDPDLFDGRFATFAAQWKLAMHAGRHARAALPSETLASLIALWGEPVA